MKCQSIIINEFGPAKSMKWEALSVPHDLADDELFIKVHYSGINFADIMMRIGLYSDAPPRPFTPGYEISGEVISKGKAVTGYCVGDKVLAGTRFGGYSSHVIVKKHQVIKLPEHLSMQEGAALPVNFMTAYLAIQHIARIQPGDRVLVDCATGGVGTICLQTLQHLGAKTVGLTGSKSKKELIESYGAKAEMRNDYYSRYTGDKFRFAINSTASRSELKSLAQKMELGGQILCLGFQTAIKDGKRSWPRVIKSVLSLPRFSPINLMMNNLTLSGINVLHYFEDTAITTKALNALHDATYLKPYIGKVYSAQDYAEAHHELESGKAQGKVLLKWV